jgi:PHD/YefM family antitoxin component YafN of YafNO toxin-antitoxin module
MSHQREVVMPKIIPIRDLKDTSTISELCHESSEPIYVTKNGYGDMVVMSMELYEDTIKELEMLRHIQISEEQIAKGETMDAFDALREIKKKHSL